jgi:DNA mismatch endonuclease (patch repair protein)
MGRSEQRGQGRTAEKKILVLFLCFCGSSTFPVDRRIETQASPLPFPSVPSTLRSATEDGYVKSVVQPLFLIRVASEKSTSKWPVSPTGHKPVLLLQIRYNPRMADFWTKEKRSEVMASIRSKGNKTTELKLISILRAHRINGWRRHWRMLGSPDFVFRQEHVAIFVDGCFWHGCRWHCRRPKSRQSFWNPKIARNRVRDRNVGRLLRKRGWRVLRLWEHSLQQPYRVARRIERMLASATVRRYKK